MLRGQIDWATLGASVSTTDDGLDLAPSVVRRLACDADLIPIALGTHGEVLDVGRTQRLVTTALWRALVCRDAHCAFPGCTRPPVMCHAHHIIHWADGGHTKLAKPGAPVRAAPPHHPPHPLGSPPQPRRRPTRVPPTTQTRPTTTRLDPQQTPTRVTLDPSSPSAPTPMLPGMTPRDDLQEIRDLWDAEAASFDEAADHGLRDEKVRAAWRDLLLGSLPPAPARVADLGCGTGTLSLLLADEGYAVDGVDVSPEMVRLARQKGGDRPDVRFAEADASNPPLEPHTFDVVLCRHVLWAMPDPAAALQRWIDLLAPGGRLLLVEGRWFNGAGLAAADTVALVEAAGRRAELTLLPEPVYWGREIDDERYLVVG